MNQPPNDSFNNSPTENERWSDLGRRQNAAESDATIKYPLPFPPNLGEVSQPGFTSPQQGVPPSGSATNYSGQPPMQPQGFGPPQAPGAYPPGVPNFQRTETLPGDQSPPPQQPGPFGPPPMGPGPAQPPKRPRKLNVVGLITAIVVLLVLIVGITSAWLFFHSKNSNSASATATALAQSTPATSGVTPVSTPTSAAGTPVQAGQVWSATETGANENSSGAVLPSGDTYLEISISLHNISNTSQTVSEEQFTLLD